MTMTHRINKKIGFFDFVKVELIAERKGLSGLGVNPLSSAMNLTLTGEVSYPDRSSYIRFNVLLE